MKNFPNAMKVPEITMGFCILLCTLK